MFICTSDTLVYWKSIGSGLFSGILLIISVQLVPLDAIVTDGISI